MKEPSGEFYSCAFVKNNVFDDSDNLRRPTCLLPSSKSRIFRHKYISALKLLKTVTYRYV